MDYQELISKVTFSERNPQRDPIQEVMLRAKKRQSEDAKLSFKDAYHGVLLADENLHRAFNEATPPVRRQRS
jgi:hypothetical protein